MIKKNKEVHVIEINDAVGQVNDYLDALANFKSAQNNLEKAKSALISIASVHYECSAIDSGPFCNFFRLEGDGKDVEVIFKDSFIFYSYIIFYNTKSIIISHIY